jgi:hypothetical protein
MCGTDIRGLAVEGLQPSADSPTDGSFRPRGEQRACHRHGWAKIRWKS